MKSISRNICANSLKRLHDQCTKKRDTMTDTMMLPRQHSRFQSFLTLNDKLLGLLICSQGMRMFAKSVVKRETLLSLMREIWCRQCCHGNNKIFAPAGIKIRRRHPYSSLVYKVTGSKLLTVKIYRR